MSAENSKNRKTRIGIFGGSFDPPHLAHFRCASIAAREAGLDLVLIMPTSQQPDKPAGTFAESELRCRMAEALFKADPLFKLSRIEIERGGISYTIDTLRELSTVYPKETHELYLILGADTLKGILSWKEPDKIFSLARVIALNRPGSEIEIPTERFAERIIAAKVPHINISSTMIRERLARGLPIKSLIGKEVAELIKQHRLYL